MVVYPRRAFCDFDWHAIWFPSDFARISVFLCGPAINSSAEGDIRDELLLNSRFLIHPGAFGCGELRVFWARVPR
jgi:hypothetical protein